jgi:glycine betaine/proline transport system permease protein
MFFGLGRVPGAIATVIFAMPPAVRLTNLGIRGVRPDLVEAGLAFGCTPRQLLRKVELPQALPSIMAGVNQAMMLALSMVVIASMIGAGGLGNEVLRGIQRLDVGLGFESGIGVVLLAIVLDRITQSFGELRRDGLWTRLRRRLGRGRSAADAA